MNPELLRKLRRMTDILWAGGVTDPITYIEQLSFLIYLKMLDEEESRRERQIRLTESAKSAVSLFPRQASRFRWSAWRFKAGTELRDFLRDEVFAYMASLVKEQPRVAEFFRDATLQVHDPNVLKQIVDIIDGIEFAKLGTDTKGDVFEYFLTHLGQAALNGQFRTPRQIRRMMVEMVDPDFGDSVFDPACGTGGFLIDAVEHILARYSEEPEELPIYGEEWLAEKGLTLEQAKQENPNLQTYRKGAGGRIPDWKRLETSLFGIEVSRSLTRITMMNLVLHDIKKAQVKRANALSEMGGLSEEDLSRKYRVILSNPPFAGTLPKESLRSDLPTKSKKSELLFLSLMMKHLAPGGRCAVIVPEGLLFGSTTAHKEMRRKLVEEFQLRAVVSLPAGVFKPYAGVKTGILIFDGPGSGGKKKAGPDKVWFCEILNDGFDPDKISGGVRPMTPEKNNIPAALDKWREYKASGFKKLPGVKANSTLAPGTEPPKSWWATLDKITENDYNLAASRYKPVVTEKPPDDDPAELIRNILKLEGEVTEGLTKLLKDIEE